MASSNNRFALLDAKSDTQPVHGVEDTIEFPVIAGPETKHKKKKKKAKQPRQISSDDQGEISSTVLLNVFYFFSVIWNHLNYFFGFSFIGRDTAKFCFIFWYNF